MSRGDYAMTHRWQPLQGTSAILTTPGRLDAFEAQSLEHLRRPRLVDGDGGRSEEIYGPKNVLRSPLVPPCSHSLRYTLTRLSRVTTRIAIWLASFSV
jgi:hypothetical protein